VYNVKYNQKKPFEKISSKSNKYILSSFDVALKLLKDKKILGFINCPISKEHLFKNKYQGITEFLSKKANYIGNEVMLIYNKKLSTAPITTHIPLREVSKKISQKKIIKKVKIINKFYEKVLNKKPNFAILGLNPHNFSPSKKSEEKLIISKAVKSLHKLKIKVTGPVSSDTSFMIFKKYKFDVIVGMYHDQVLTPFKTLYNFDAINITLGLPFIRISPDHGIAENITGKNIANPKSLIEAIKFFNNIS
jgi:4-hydroxythreonine-4-phosphate dehydrogenase